MTVPYGRHTVRLTDLYHYVALALGGSAGARTADRLCCPVSADIQICLILSKGAAIPRGGTPRVIAVDDWARRREQDYGTILVDPEKNKVIHLLAARQAKTLAVRLKLHPRSEIIAWDRAGVYADGGRQGAPSAIVVTDRWHLLRNMSGCLSTHR
ncbi:transposase [Nguyenibacter sp. L1]|uniref:transposase n=1 Tax=Nguyenibacter sp. L1 TaxID=3049350 RepID=UPI002B4729F7|nr:transposase [Nguyenibacter sp. L1]WRH86371.1 transposase [Nguyenibacter sp. L1]